MTAPSAAGKKAEKTHDALASGDVMAPGGTWEQWTTIVCPWCLAPVSACRHEGMPSGGP